MEDNENKQNRDNEIKSPLLEQAVESWARLCLFHIQQKNQSANKNKNQKKYADIKI